MTIAVVVQARMASSRLPEKVMLPVLGEPLLARMLERLQHVTTPIELIVATTTDAEDSPIKQLCDRIGVRCFEGHPLDLLDRHYRAAQSVGADAVAKIPSDCPLIDPAIVDLVLGEFLAHRDQVDFVSNLRPATWPDGNDVEVMPLSVLETAWLEAERKLEREHTTPFIWERPERFRCLNVAWAGGRDLSQSHRFTIDYREDYELISAVYEALYPEHGVFSLEQILALLQARPELLELNHRYAGKSWHLNHLDELRTVSRKGDKLEWDG